MSVSDRAEQRAEVASEKTRSFVFPIVAAILLFVVMVTLQFSTLLGQYGFIAEVPLAIGFYYCYAWHGRLAARAKAHELTLDRK
jgi:Zn-dependent protease